MSYSRQETGLNMFTTNDWSEEENIQRIGEGYKQRIYLALVIGLSGLV